MESISKRGIKFDFDADVLAVKARLPVPPRPDFDSEPWEGRIECEDGWLFRYSISITQGAMRWGPDGGWFYAMTYAGAQKKMARLLQKKRREQSRKLAFQDARRREAEAEAIGLAELADELTTPEGWDKAFNRAKRGR
jgi:hypothetical protein